MSDDETTEELLDEEDVLGEGDLEGDLFEDDAVGEDDAFDDDESDDEDEEAESPLPLDVSEDGDDELDGEPPVDLTAIEGLDVDDPLEVAAEDDEDPNDTIREGEFVCSACHMAKRSSALADADEMLCRDCVLRSALALAVLAGLAWSAAHPPVGWWWLAFVVVPAWLTAVLQVADGRARDAFLVGVTTGVTALLPMVWWLAAPATPIAPVLLALAIGVYVGAASVAVQPWVRRPVVGLIGPVVWAGCEVVRARWPFSGFGWGDLATAHVDGSWMLTSARVLGADGLTLLTALLGGMLWVTVQAANAAWLDPATQDQDAMSPGAARVVRTFDKVRPLAMATLAVPILGTLITVAPPEQIGEVDVLVVQGSDGVARTTGLAEDLRILESHVAATRDAIEDEGVPDLTVWAENAVDADPTGAAGAPLQPPLDTAGRLTEGRLLTGLTRDGPRPGTFRNQIVRIHEDGSLGRAYDKIEIVPFGEYVPFRSVLGGIGPLQRVPRDAIPGTGPVTHEVGGVRVASIICFETLFPGIVRAAVAHEDAGLLVAATNDSSFGETAESAQHVAQSRLRAVETGRSVAHASISGTSALITPDGAVVALAPLFEVATIRATLPVVSGSTPAATVGPVVSGLLGTAFIVLLLWRLWQLVQDRRQQT